MKTNPITSWYIYIVQCKDNALYTGITTNVEKRLATHNNGKGSKSVRAHGLPCTLVWSKLVGTKSEALKLEYQTKQLSRKDKLELISKG